MTISALVYATSSQDEDSYIELFHQDTLTSLIDDFIYNGLTSMNSNSGDISFCNLLETKLYKSKNLHLPYICFFINNFGTRNDQKK